jgi:hypothetical protein
LPLPHNGEFRGCRLERIHCSRLLHRNLRPRLDTKNCGRQGERARPVVGSRGGRARWRTVLIAGSSHLLSAEKAGYRAVRPQCCRSTPMSSSGAGPSFGGLGLPSRRMWLRSRGRRTAGSTAHWPRRHCASVQRLITSKACVREVLETRIRPPNGSCSAVIIRIALPTPAEQRIIATIDEALTGANKPKLHAAVLSLRPEALH